MGAYLSQPVTKKNSEDESNGRISYGVSSMQGWRVNQEDAHNCIIDFDDSISLFGVYDGHGGFEVAKYMSIKFPDFLKNTEKYKLKDYENALIEAFLGFDDTIVKPEVELALKELVKAESKNDLAGRTEHDDMITTRQAGDTIATAAGCSSKSDEDDYDEFSDEILESPEALRLDADKPIEEVVASYQNPSINNLGMEGKPASPYLRGRRDVKLDGGNCDSCSSKIHENTSTDDFKVIEENKNETNGGVRADGSDSKTRSNSETGGFCNMKEKKFGTAYDYSSEGIRNEAGVLANGSTEAMKDNTNENPAELDVSESSNGSQTATPSTSQKKKKLNLEDLDDSTIIKQFITNDEISEDDEEDSEDETFDPIVETDDDDDEDDDDEDEDSENINNIHIRLASKGLTRILKGLNQSSDDDEDSDEDDDEQSNSHSSDIDEDVECQDEEEDHDENDDDDDDDDKLNPGIDSGCTAVVALIKGTDLYVANAGDSRCIASKSGHAVDMSEDHKPEDPEESDRIIKAGGTVTRDGRVNGGLNLSRAIGDHSYKINHELPNTEQMITALPDVRKLKLEHDVEFLVLACDGIWNSMSSQEVIDFVRPKIQSNMKLSTICEELFEKCLASDMLGDGAGCDNMTCIIVTLSSREGNEPETQTLEGISECVDTIKSVIDQNEVNNAVVENDMRKVEELNPQKCNDICENVNSNCVTTSKMVVHKRSAEESQEVDGNNKRQKTENSNRELNSCVTEPH